MKTIRLKMAMVTLILFVGSLSLSAQIGRGGSCLRTSTTTVETQTCVNPQLTAEQQSILDDLRIEFQADMDAMRSAMWAATSIADKIAIRNEMVALRDAHLAEVKALLAEWGY